MHYMRSFVGWIVMPLLRGTVFLRPVASIELRVLILRQDIGPCGSAYTYNAPSYCVHAPLVPSTLQALHSRA